MSKWQVYRAPCGCVRTAGGSRVECAALTSARRWREGFGAWWWGDAIAQHEAAVREGAAQVGLVVE